MPSLLLPLNTWKAYWHQERSQERKHQYQDLKVKFILEHTEDHHLSLRNRVLESIEWSRIYIYRRKRTAAMINKNSSPMIIYRSLSCWDHIDICVVSSRTWNNAENWPFVNFTLVLRQNPVQRNYPTVSSFYELSMISKSPFVNHTIHSFSQKWKN